MKKKAYVVLGHGIPEGETVYVVTITPMSSDVKLWNATTVHRLSPSPKAAYTPICLEECHVVIARLLEPRSKLCPTNR